MTTAAPQLETAAEVSRRAFIASLSAGSLVLMARLSGAVEVQALDLESADSDAVDGLQPDLFVSIAPDGTVTIVAHRSEMGTGIRTSLPTVLADELGADWKRVVIQQALGDRRLGSQNTDGSCSIRNFFDRMRVAGATARTLLERAAAERWSVPADQCRADNHAVAHVATGRQVDFADLVEAARKLPVPKADELVYRRPAERRYIGKEVAITDLDDIVTGKAVFGIDARRPKQLYAVIARPAVLGGAVKKFDPATARAVPGVVEVVEIPRFKGTHAFQPLGGVAVCGTSTWAAIQGRDALDIEWDDGAHASYDSEAYRRKLVAASRTPDKVIRTEGDFAKAIAAAPSDAVFEADYYVPHLAHASMEPPCALAEVDADDAGQVTACRVWAATQNPQACQQVVGAMLGLPPEKVEVNVTLLGSAFGRKSKPDYVAEAVYLARATKRPVHVTWTREDDIAGDYLHTVAAVHMKAVIGERGLPTAWLQRSAFPPIPSTFDSKARYAADFEMGLGATDLPYNVANLQIENGAAEAHVRIGWLRSVAHIYHAFAVCSFPDELAHRAGRDPYEYLLELLGPDRHVPMTGVAYPNHGEPLQRFPIDVARLRQVTERAAELAEWGRRLPRGRGLGIACHRSFLSYCAHVVQVDVTKTGQVRIPHVWVVIDAGLIINPDRVRAQLEGAAVFSTALTRFGEITVARGRIEQSNFHDYELSRIDDAPRHIVVDIVPSEAPPAGVGEVGVPTFAPALTNAIFAATGKRVRRLPLSKHDLSWA